MTSEDVNDLMEKTRNVMLHHLKEMDLRPALQGESETVPPAVANGGKANGKTTATSVGKEEETSVKKRRTLKD